MRCGKWDGGEGVTALTSNREFDFNHIWVVCSTTTLNAQKMVFNLTKYRGDTVYNLPSNCVLQNDV